MLDTSWWRTTWAISSERGADTIASYGNDSAQALRLLTARAFGGRKELAPGFNSEIQAHIIAKSNPRGARWRQSARFVLDLEPVVADDVRHPNSEIFKKAGGPSLCLGSHMVCLAVPAFNRIHVTPSWYRHEVLGVVETFKPLHAEKAVDLFNFFS